MFSLYHNTSVWVSVPQRSRDCHDTGPNCHVLTPPILQVRLIGIRYSCTNGMLPLRCIVPMFGWEPGRFKHEKWGFYRSSQRVTGILLMGICQETRGSKTPGSGMSFILKRILIFSLVRDYLTCEWCGVGFLVNRHYAGERNGYIFHLSQAYVNFEISYILYRVPIQKVPRISNS